MTLEEALHEVRKGKSVRRPLSVSTWVHINPEWECTLRPEDRLAEDWRVYEAP